MFYSRDIHSLLRKYKQKFRMELNILLSKLQIFIIITNFMKLSPSWEAANHATI
jgi:hypothetical protein